MSIWCSWPSVGHDTFADEGPIRGGEVRTYANGFSNHYPNTEGTHELPASVDLAHIAPWCVPGHGDPCEACERGHDHPEVGPWLRLGITAEAGLNFWTKNQPEGMPTRERVEADAVLDEAAVLRLYHDLGEWLMMPKVRPGEKRNEEGK